jgi:hypothetical protein
MTPFAGSGKLADVGRVSDVHLFYEGVDLTLELRLDELTSDRPVRLRFRRVAGLKLFDNFALSGVVLLVAEDIAARGWERRRFAVSDCEEAFASFWCERIERA